MSNAPLYKVLTDRALKGKKRFHMPGHKGKDVFSSAIAGASSLDFTELYGTGNLYDGTYPIADAEKEAAKAFNVPEAYFLTGGTTQGIYAAVRLIIKKGDKVLMDRGCHKSVYRALALFDAVPVYIQAKKIKEFGIESAILAEDVDKALCDNPDIRAVILTCPTYYGIVCDVEKISKSVHAHGARLIVDQAHGAHFPFTPGMNSAVALGADVGVTSLHKTLPALGQAAIICTDGKIPAEKVRRATSLFGTSSPSYAIMASMDLTREYMQGEGSKRCRELAERLEKLRSNININSLLMALEYPGGDPLRLCICTRNIHMSGYQAAAYLENECDVVCEMADVFNVLFIITPADDQADIEVLENALMRLASLKGTERFTNADDVNIPKAKLTPHQALISESRAIRLSESCGEIAAESICPYPPGIPAVALGEVIEKQHIEYLYKRGFFPDDMVEVVAK